MELQILLYLAQHNYNKGFQFYSVMSNSLNTHCCKQVNTDVYHNQLLTKQKNTQRIASPLVCFRRKTNHLRQTSTRLKFFSQSLQYLPKDNWRRRRTSPTKVQQGVTLQNSVCEWENDLWFQALVSVSNMLHVHVVPLIQRKPQGMFWAGLSFWMTDPIRSSTLFRYGYFWSHKPNWQQTVTGGFRNKSTNPWVTSH